MSNFADKDHGYRALMQRMMGIKRVLLTVGVHDEEAEEKKQTKSFDAQGNKIEGVSEKTTVALVATVHEYGLGVPERSFLRAWYDESKEKNLEAFRRIYRGVVRGQYDGKTGLDRLGLKFVALIQNRISRGIEPELSEITIKRKRSSKPLVNTGQLKSSIRHRLDLRTK